MPLAKQSSNSPLHFKVYKADKLFSRIFGLLGTEQLDHSHVLYIPSCSSIHTIGMKYPIDVLFVDKTGVIIKKITNLLPNRFTKLYMKADGVLEFAAGEIDKNAFFEGQQLLITPDESRKLNFTALPVLLHLPLNILLSMLWGRFAIHSLNHFITYDSLVAAGLFIVNTILFLLFLTRRQSKITSNSVIDWLIAFFTVVLSFNYKTLINVSGIFQNISSSIQVIGILLLIISLLSLGRSFGIVPANRIIKQNGAYQWIRHPIYSSEIIFYIGFVIGNWNIQNLIITLLIISGQLFRAHAEEKLLLHDNEYKNYTTKVIYRFLPGLY